MAAFEQFCGNSHSNFLKGAIRKKKLGNTELKKLYL